MFPVCVTRVTWHVTWQLCSACGVCWPLLSCLVCGGVWPPSCEPLPHTELKHTNWWCLGLNYTLMFSCNQPSTWQRLSAFKHTRPKLAAEFSLSAEGKGEFSDFECGCWCFRRRISAERKLYRERQQVAAWRALVSRFQRKTGCFLNQPCNEPISFVSTHSWAVVSDAVAGECLQLAVMRSRLTELIRRR